MANPIVTDLPICGYYDQQRFRQFGPASTSNWYLQESNLGKKKVAMYPTLGRRRVNLNGLNQLIFDDEPRFIDKTVNSWYAVVADRIFRIDRFFTVVDITAAVRLTTLTGDIFSSFIVINTGSSGAGSGITFVGFTDGQHLYLYREETNEFGIVTDSNLPKNPWAIASFGNRFVVSTRESSAFGLSEINLNYNATFATMLGDCFTIGSSAIFAQEEGIIRQMGVLQNTLYMFLDYTTGIWSNIPSTLISAGGTPTSFPWSKNTSYSFDFGMSAANANTLDIDFGMMVWVGQNRNGLVQPMISTGGKPQRISSKAIDVLLQRDANADALDPFTTGESDAFLYDYENTIFYRISAGPYTGSELVDEISTAHSIEYNFDTKTWHKCIEANGERNRIQQHIFFDNRHLVTVLNDPVIYQFSGQYYNNEIVNPAQPNRQAPDAFLQLPFRYERVTNIIVAGMIEGLKPPGFYAEFKTNYVEIDFVWGEDSSFFSPNVTDVTLSSENYYNWFKPNIELYFSNDGGITFQTAGQLEFSQVGVYQWRMRWYQLGCSRNRVYKLICVSPSPIVVLGGTMEVENVSGGAA